MVDDNWNLERLEQLRINLHHSFDQLEQQLWEIRDCYHTIGSRMETIIQELHHGDDYFQRQQHLAEHILDLTAPYTN